MKRIVVLRLSAHGLIINRGATRDFKINRKCDHKFLDILRHRMENETDHRHLIVCGVVRLFIVKKRTRVYGE